MRAHPGCHREPAPAFPTRSLNERNVRNKFANPLRRQVSYATIEEVQEMNIMFKGGPMGVSALSFKVSGTFGSLVSVEESI